MAAPVPQRGAQQQAAGARGAAAPVSGARKRRMEKLEKWDRGALAARRERVRPMRIARWPRRESRATATLANTGRTEAASVIAPRTMAMKTKKVMRSERDVAYQKLLPEHFQAVQGHIRLMPEKDH